MFGDAGRPVELRQLDVERRHGGQAGDAFPFQRPEHVARQQVVEQDDAGANVEGCRQLAEAGVEGQGQGGEQGVVAGVFEVAGNALCAGDHVAMREDDAFGLAGAA